MRPAGSVGPIAGAPPRDEHAELRRLAHQLEGMFLSQLFEAMRASVPEGGLLKPSAGEELFTSLLDDSLAVQAAERMNRGIGEALYRQLSRRLDAGDPPAE